MSAAGIGAASRLHVEMSGGTGPLIVFEAGSGADCSVWRRVIALLGPGVRTFAYDRAGIGLSDPTGRPTDAASSARDLIRALAARGCDAPAVLVAHSLGALIARHVVLARPASVAALVLVEPVHEDMYERLANREDPDRPLRRMRRAMAMLRGMEQLCRIGLPRLALRLWPGIGRELGLTLRPNAAEMLGNPVRWRMIVRAAEAFGTSGERLRGQTLGALPLIVLTGAAPDNPMRGASGLPRRVFRERWRALHRELAALSTRGRQTDVEAGHNIHIEAPEAVVRAIGDVLDQVGHKPA